MAASASLSNAFSLYSPRSVSLKPSHHLSLQPTSIQQFVVHGKPISRAAVSSSPVLNAYWQFGINSRFGNNWYRNDRRSSLRPSDSAQHENQTYNEDKSGSDRAASKKSQPDMKSLMQLYKEAIAYGDARAMYEIENILFTIDKEKIELADRVSALSEEVSSGKEKFLRLQADFDNYRKRSEKERATVRSDAQGEVIESLLPMVDSFERAKQQLKIETEMEKKIDTSYQGIYKQFIEIMRSLRVAAVPTVGKPFDPSMHEAIAREESHEFKEGIVIQEFRRGFYLADRLIRPAMVKVSTGPGRKKPLSEQQASVARVDNR
ncbi:uncharacterized protein LOC131014727 [Salvia miltiorrhiza]|uniref:uncharacterized protein LOC131014727 n=1 Tax=Salvia miltiorrhiza TaxID=226208 RepID=UPI0025AC06F5|nr:uncharacterized protein LOC131014727 [Salvia miltiorrhiza]